MLARLGDEATRPLGLRDVDGEALRADLRRGGRHTLAIARADHDAHALVRERLRRRESETRRGGRDGGGTARDA